MTYNLTLILKSRKFLYIPEALIGSWISPTCFSQSMGAIASDKGAFRDVEDSEEKRRLRDGALEEGRPV
jgi:hypothetical protein